MRVQIAETAVAVISGWVVSDAVEQVLLCSVATDPSTAATSVFEHLSVFAFLTNTCRVGSICARLAIFCARCLDTDNQHNSALHQPKTQALLFKN